MDRGAWAALLSGGPLWLGFLIGFAAEWEDAGRPADDPELVKERWRGWR